MTVEKKSLIRYNQKAGSALRHKANPAKQLLASQDGNSVTTGPKSHWLQSGFSWPAGSQWLAFLLQKRRGFSLLLLLLGLLLLAGHQLLPVIDRDEARFAQASKQMVETGDIIIIRFQDEWRAKKPAGIYWLQAASASLFSLDNIAAYRMPSLLGFLASLFLVWHFVRSLWPDAPHSQQMISMLGLASGLLILAEAHLAKTDSVLLAVCLFQQFMLWRIWRDRHLADRRPHWAGFWAAMGIGILIKGPVAPMLAGLTLAGLLLSGLILSEGKTGWLRHLAVWRGLGLVLIIAGPWALAVSLATDGAFLGIAIGEDLLPKLASGQEAHGAPPGSYLIIFWLLVFPASLLLTGLLRLNRAFLASDAARFCLAWLVGYWLLAELIPTKLPHYILPVLPALILLSAAGWQMPARPAGWRFVASLAMAGLSLLGGAVLLGALGWAAAMLGGASGAVAFIAALAAGLLFCWIGWQAYQLLWADLHSQIIAADRRLAKILLAGILFNWLAVSGVIAHLDRLHLADRVAEQLAGQKTPPTALGLAGWHEPSAIFRLGRDTLLLDGREAALLLAEAPSAHLVIESRQMAAFEQAASQLGLQFEEFAVIEGVNLSRWQPARLALIRHSAFDAGKTNR